jgi:hypothetical protein
MHMKNLKTGLLILAVAVTSCSQQKKQKQEVQTTDVSEIDLVAVLDTIWTTEQEPIRKRDAMLDAHGIDSKEFEKYQGIYKKNHIINEQKIIAILAEGWPDKEVIGESGNRTICNVLQHSDYEIREKYLPLMRQAVKEQQLSPQLLVRAEDRLATDHGELQIYGGQMKYYPETKSFNVWPVYDPVNIDQRRAEIGLGPITEHLKNRFDFEWNLEEQIKRSAAFETERKNNMK